jgi:hypothetical protein
MKQMYLFTLISLGLLACKKTEGPAGKDGVNGNANVTSEAFYVAGSDFVQQSDPKVFHYKKYVPNLSVNDGVSVSLASSPNDFYFTLPIFETDFEYSFAVKTDTLLLYQFQNTSVVADDFFYSLQITKAN